MNNKKIIKIKHKVTQKTRTKTKSRKTLNKNNKTLNNKTLNNKTLNNKTLNNKTLNNKTLNNKILNNKTLNNKTLNNKTLNNKTLNNKTLNNTIKKSEIYILIHIITNEIIFLLKQNNSKKYIKTKIIKLLKDIRNNNKLINKNTTDKELILFFNSIYKQSKVIYEPAPKLQINTKINKGGYYFKTIEDKKDKPITGNDIAILLDEIQEFFTNAQYTDEGAFMKSPNTLLGLLRGDTDSFKQYVMSTILPKYITTVPPFIKWDGISKIFEEKKYEDIPDYLLAYQSYMKSQDDYLVKKGLKSPDLVNSGLNTGFMNKLANAMDDNMNAFHKYKNLAQGNAPLSMLTL